MSNNTTKLTTVSALLGAIEANNLNPEARKAERAEKRREFLSRSLVVEGRIVPVSKTRDFATASGKIMSGPNQGANFEAVFINLENAKIVRDRDEVVAAAQAPWLNVKTKRTTVKLWIAFQDGSDEPLPSTTRFNPEAVRAYKDVYVVGRPSLEVTFLPEEGAKLLCEALEAVQTMRKEHREYGDAIAKKNLEEAIEHHQGIYEMVKLAATREFFDTPDDVEIPDGQILWTERLVLKAHSFGLKKSLTHQRHEGREVVVPESAPETEEMMTAVDQAPAGVDPFQIDYLNQLDVKQA